jgi:hypothetical protein
MQSIGRSDAFDSHDLAIRNHRQQHNAGVHGAVRSPAMRIDIDNCDRARAAITLGAAFLRACSARGAKPLEERRIDRNAIDRRGFAVNDDFKR